jgi:hypothetical protein
VFGRPAWIFNSLLLIAGAACALLAATQSTSRAAGWAEEFTAGNFTFRSEFPLRDVQDLLNDIADLQTDLQDTLGLECASGEIQVHLFRSKYSYQRYLAVRVPEGIKRQALFMPGPDAGRIYAYRHRGMATDVRHETTHALLRQALPYVPLWLDEGLAEYFEVPGEERQTGHGHLGEIRRAIFFGWKPDLPELEAKRDFLDMGAKDYRDAWAIVHFLVHGPPEARAALATHFKQIESGQPPKPLSELLRDALPDYEREIIRHLK